tara:strand:+ start:1933 stop:2142 length:210 start_codon:yes stop_codon:yes gene_type:complete
LNFIEGAVEVVVFSMSEWAHSLVLKLFTLPNVVDDSQYITGCSLELINPSPLMKMKRLGIESIENMKKR